MAFKEVVLKVLYEDDDMILRVVQWGKGVPIIVRQKKWMDGEGNSRFTRVKGIRIQDLELIKEHLSEIETLLVQG